jgi:hypothetical protein
MKPLKLYKKTQQPLYQIFTENIFKKVNAILTLLKKLVELSHSLTAVKKNNDYYETRKVFIKS